MLGVRNGDGTYSMLNKELIAAIKSESKVLQKEQQSELEKDFIVENWQFFADTKGAVKGALFKAHPKNGNELMEALGISQVCFHKVPKELVVRAVMELSGTEVFKMFLKDVQDKGECTSFFVVQKRAMVISNSVPLVVPGKTIHKFPSQGKLNDIYWQWADNLKERIRFY